MEVSIGPLPKGILYSYFSVSATLASCTAGSSRKAWGSTIVNSLILTFEFMRASEIF